MPNDTLQRTDELREIIKRRPLEAAAIAAMTDSQRLAMMTVMERGFSRASWWSKVIMRINARVLP